jgi:hypothetical protein
MKREIYDLERYVSVCCPGHDTFPNDTYDSNRSKRARSRDIKLEHRYVRHLKNAEVKLILKHGV